MRSDRRPLRATATIAAAALVLGALALSGTSAAGRSDAPSAATCAARPWTGAAYQSRSTPEQLASTVLSCLKQRFPGTYRHDEVGIVALNSYPWFQNVNEFGLTSTVQRQLAALGMPPITLQDGPGGLITKTVPSPTQMTNQLALGATFSTGLATLYGTVLGTEARVMGYDGVQAPDLNLLRVPTWGRASESYGESSVLAGELGAAEAVAIEAQHEIPVLKHFGPYSQDTDRRFLNQAVTPKALQELYIRPFTFVLRALLPQLAERNHAVGVMCSYGNINDLKACRSPLLANELAYVGVDALVRSDLDVEVNPSALVLNGVDLVKPMNAPELVAALKNPALDRALDQSVAQIFETEFADGLVNGAVTSARAHRLSANLSQRGLQYALQIEKHAAVLLKDAGGILPLTRGDRRIALVTDSTLTGTCLRLASELEHALGVTTSCTNDSRVSLPHESLFSGLPFSRNAWVTRSTTVHLTHSGPYEVRVTTIGNAQVSVDGRLVFSTRGLAEYAVQRSAQVSLAAGPHTIQLSYRGEPPQVLLEFLGPAVGAAITGVRGASVALVLAYDLAREGMDRDSLSLPNGQDAVISAVAARVPTVAVLGTDGAVTMPWLSAVRGVVEMWNPTGSVQLDSVFSQFVPAWTAVLDGAVDPSGRLPVTFPASTAQSPAGQTAFWPGDSTTVNLGLPPSGGVGIGMPWYRAAGWPVLFPFGYGLGYTSFALEGGSLQSDQGGLTMTVAVRDTGDAAGQVPVQVYANFPAAAGEPRQQLVGFAVANFTAAQAQAGTVVDVTVPLLGDAFTVLTGSSMRLMKGNYCLEAAQYAGDPHAWSTGTVALAPNAGGSSLTSGSEPLGATPCPQ